MNAFLCVCNSDLGKTGGFGEKFASDLCVLDGQMLGDSIICHFVVIVLSVGLR